jgi:hypothetical protein
MDIGEDSIGSVGPGTKSRSAGRWERRAAIRVSSLVAPLAAILGVVAWAGPGRAQELEPRAYSPTPTGANFLLIAGGHTTGDIVFDPAIPITNASANVNSGTFAYSRSFRFFGRSASAAVAESYVWGTASGDVFEEFRSVDRSGFGDLKLRFVTNLVGGPARTPAEFATQKPTRTLGASLVVSAPTGQYYSDKLVNIGANRWAFKPELGFSQPHKRWFFDAYAGGWFYTDNTRFYPGTSVRSQEPLWVFQVHVSYTFKPRLWISGDGTYYTGGRTTVDGVTNADLQGNTRLGLTLSVPVGRRNSVKIAWAGGTTTRVGGSFDTLSAIWQFFWFD